MLSFLVLLIEELVRVLPCRKQPSLTLIIITTTTTTTSPRGHTTSHNNSHIPLTRTDESKKDILLRERACGRKQTIPCLLPRGRRVLLKSRAYHRLQIRSGGRAVVCLPLACRLCVWSLRTDHVLWWTPSAESTANERGVNAAHHCFAQHTSVASAVFSMLFVVLCVVLFVVFSMLFSIPSAVDTSGGVSSSVGSSRNASMTADLSTAMASDAGLRVKVVQSETREREQSEGERKKGKVKGSEEA